MLLGAFESTPERFVRGVPKPTPLPVKAWINKPDQEEEEVPADDDVVYGGAIIGKVS